jgi:hypothetical protein
MQGVNSDPLGRCTGGLGQTFLELPLSARADADPVHGTKHDRLAFADDDDTATTQRHIVGGDRIVGQRTADRRRGVHIEDRKLHRL